MRGPLPDVAAATGPGPYVVVHPGAAVPARRMTLRRSRELVLALVRAGYRVVVTGGPGEAEMTAFVAGTEATDLGGATTMPELAAVLAGASVVVTPNTGPAHLAAAVGAPIVSLFAPVVPAARWAPVAEHTIVLGDQRAPCANTRARTCPVPDRHCLDAIRDEEILAAVEELEESR